MDPELVTGAVAPAAEEILQQQVAQQQQQVAESGVASALNVDLGSALDVVEVVSDVVDTGVAEAIGGAFEAAGSLLGSLFD